MSKKKKHNSTGPKSRSARPAGSVGPTGHASRASKSTAESRLLSTFARWYAQTLDPAEEEDWQVEVETVRATLDVLMDLTRTLGPRLTLAAPTAQTLRALIEHTTRMSDDAATDNDTAAANDAASDLANGTLDEDALSSDVTADADPDDLSASELELSERVEALVDLLENYLDFLGETNGWRASDDEFNASYAVLAQAVNDLTVTGAMVGLLVDAIDELEPVSPAAQLQALNALPIVAGVDGLLSWLGTSKPVTSTGSVRLADIEPVAALIGINAVGQLGAENSDLAQHLYEAATSHADASTDTEPQQAASMWDISALGTWWVALSQAGLIHVGATTVRPGPDVEKWQATDATTQLTARSEFVERYVQEWLEREAANETASSAHTLTRLISMLVAAVSPSMLPELGSAAVADAIDEELHYDSDDAAATFAASLVLHHLTKAGIVEPHQAADGTSRSLAPEGVRPTLARTITPLVAALS